MSAQQIVPVGKIKPNGHLEEEQKLTRRFSEPTRKARQVVPVVKLLNLSDLLEYHQPMKRRKLERMILLGLPILKIPRLPVPKKKVSALRLYRRDKAEQLEKKKLKLAEIIVEKLKLKDNIKMETQEKSVPQRVDPVPVKTDMPEPMVIIERLPEIEEVVQMAYDNVLRNTNTVNDAQQIDDSDNSCLKQNNSMDSLHTSLKYGNTKLKFRSLFYCDKCGRIFTYHLYLMQHQLRHRNNGDGILRDISNSATGRKSHRMLSDDQVWAGLKDLASSTILVLPPAICLKIIHSGQEDIRNVLQGIDFQKLAIIAPISNAESNDAGFNTEGTHWSLVVVNLKNKEFGHLDSIPGYNKEVALQFCHNINQVLNFNTFKFSTKKCHKQNDKYSCGLEVIKNAKKQVKLLQKLKSPIKDVPKKAETGYKQRLVIIGDEHGRNMTEVMAKMMPHYDVSFDMTLCGDDAMCNIPLLTQHMSSNDCILAIKGSEHMDPAHYASAATQICALMAGTKATLTGTFPDVPHLTFFMYTVRKSFKEID